MVKGGKERRRSRKESEGVEYIGKWVEKREGCKYRRMAWGGPGVEKRGDGMEREGEG